jgi:hypothetical protein
MRLPLPQRRRVPRERVAPGPRRGNGPAEHDRAVHAFGRALLELFLQRVTGRGAPREQHQAARVAIDAMHDVGARAPLVPIMVDQQIDQRDFLSRPVGQRFDQQADRLVDDDDGVVLIDDRQKVPLVADGAIRRLGRSGAIHPDADSLACDHTIGAAGGLDRFSVDINLAAVEPLRGPAAGSGVGSSGQPLIEPHPLVGALDDPLAHPVALSEIRSDLFTASAVSPKLGPTSFRVFCGV